MLSAQKFNRLTNPEKYGILEKYGTFLECTRTEGLCKVALYDLCGYYVEVSLDQSLDKVTGAVAFTSYKRLDLYLSQISIGSI